MPRCSATRQLYTARLLYITSIAIFGQHYKIEALISECGINPAVWNVLTPAYTDRVTKKQCLEQKDISMVLHCLQYINKLPDINNILAILCKAVPFKCNKFYFFTFL